MSLKPDIIGEIPSNTARITRAAFRKPSPAMRLRDEFGTIFTDQDFAALFPKRGQPGFAPWKLALVTVLQFMENLTDRQAADAVRARLDWKYALGLELDHSGFDASILSEFRTRLIAGNAETLLLEKLLDVCKSKGFVKAGGRQRTDSTHVLAAVRHLNLLELVGETLRATLNDLAAIAPDWLRELAPNEWFERYAHRIETYRLPKGRDARDAWLLEVGQDGFLLLDALHKPEAPPAAHELPLVGTLKSLWERHFEREGEHLRWLADSKPPPDGHLASPYDTQARYAEKNAGAWVGYRVHLTETCDDHAPHLITQVHTHSAILQDVTFTGLIHDKLKAKGLTPGTHLVDTGYMSGDHLVDAARDGTRLIGPLRPNSSWQMKTPEAYDLSRFDIDWERQRVTCPQGKLSVCWHERLEKGRRPITGVHFARVDCQPCSARSWCTRGRGPRHLAFTQREQFQAIAEARALVGSEAWLVEYHRRAGIEGAISQGVRAFGLRRARYVGLRKAGLQELAVAAGMNVARLSSWLAGERPLGTRVSRLLTLRQAA